MRIPVVTCVFAAFALCALFLPRGRWVAAAICGLLAAVSWPVYGIDIAHPFKELPAVTNDEATRIAQQLHTGTYGALDHGTEQRIYESLETHSGRQSAGKALPAVAQKDWRCANREVPSHGCSRSSTWTVIARHMRTPRSFRDSITTARGSSRVRWNTGDTSTNGAISFPALLRIEPRNGSLEDHVSGNRRPAEPVRLDATAGVLIQ